MPFVSGVSGLWIAKSILWWLDFKKQEERVYDDIISNIFAVDLNFSG